VDIHDLQKGVYTLVLFADNKKKQHTTFVKE
jgi:hypothetical protein